MQDPIFILVAIFESWKKKEKNEIEIGSEEPN